MTATECLKHSWLQKISRSQTRKHLSKKHHIKFFARKKWRRVMKVIVAVVRMQMLVKFRRLQEAEILTTQPVEKIPMLSWKERMDLMKRRRSSVSESTLAGVGITAAARRTRIKSSTTRGEAYHTSISSGYESSSSSNTADGDDYIDSDNEETTTVNVLRAVDDYDSSGMTAEGKVLYEDENISESYKDFEDKTGALAENSESLSANYSASEIFEILDDGNRELEGQARRHYAEDNESEISEKVEEESGIMVDQSEAMHAEDISENSEKLEVGNETLVGQTETVHAEDNISENSDKLEAGNETLVGQTETVHAEDNISENLEKLEVGNETLVGQTETVHIENSISETSEELQAVTFPPAASSGIYTNQDFSDRPISQKSIVPPIKGRCIPEDKHPVDVGSSDKIIKTVDVDAHDREDFAIGGKHLKEFQYPVSNTYLGGTSYTMAAGVKEIIKPRQPKSKENTIEGDEKTLDIIDNDMMTSSRTESDGGPNSTVCSDDDDEQEEEYLDATVGRYGNEDLIGSDTSNKSSEDNYEDEMPTRTAAKPEPAYPSTQLDFSQGSSSSGSPRPTSELGYHINSPLAHANRHSTSDLRQAEVPLGRRVSTHVSTGDLHISRPAEIRPWKPDDQGNIREISSSPGFNNGIPRYPINHLHSTSSDQVDNSEKLQDRSSKGQLGYRRSSSKKLNSSCEDIPEYKPPPLNTLSRRQARVAAILRAGSTESSDGSVVADNPLPTSSIQLDGLKEITIKHEFEKPSSFQSSGSSIHNPGSSFAHRAHPSDEYWSDTNYGDPYESRRRQRSGSYGPTPIPIRHGSGSNPLSSHDKKQPRLAATSMDNVMPKEPIESYISPRRVREWSVESDRPLLSRGSSPMNTLERRRARIAAILNPNDDIEVPRPRHRSGSREASIGRYRPA